MKETRDPQERGCSTEAATHLLGRKPSLHRVSVIQCGKENEKIAFIINQQQLPLPPAPIFTTL